jgi:hypothetical protein
VGCTRLSTANFVDPCRIGQQQSREYPKTAGARRHYCLPTSGSSPDARACAHRPQWRPSVAEVYLLVPERLPVPGRYLFHELIKRRTTDARAPLMPQIMIRCRRTKKAIPTGLTTELLVLESLSIPIDSLILTSKARCCICGSKHKWNHKDAWVAGGSVTIRRYPITGGQSGSPNR